MRRETEREKLQREISTARAQDKDLGSPPRVSPIPIKQITRDGELLFVFPDADRHERRVQRADLAGCDRLFWVTISIACGTPGSIYGVPLEGLGTLAKRYGKLTKARNDLTAFFHYYRPMQLGDPFLVGTPPGLGKSPGFFDCTESLDNPTTEQLLASTDRVRRWVENNQEDPEYISFQLNFCFSGHGELEDEGFPSIVLADGHLDARDLASLLLRCIPETEVTPGPCRLDLYLDCCHSSKIASRVFRNIVQQQQGINRSKRSTLNIGQVYCACLDDEDSFEFSDLEHSVFTFAFLNECSRKRPQGATTTNLGLRDVGWYTEGKQHPLLLDFTIQGGWEMKFPSQYCLTHPPRPGSGHLPTEVPKMDPNFVAFDSSGTLVFDPIATSARRAQSLRALCAGAERQLWGNPDLRTPYSREEILTNTKFPFL